jgi:hypothetical protein
MKRKLYFMIDSIENANRMMQELLLKRVDDSHISFYTKSRAELGDLPKAGIMERTGMFNGGMAGCFIGAAFGFIAGLLVVLLPNPWFPEWYVPASPATIITITTVIGVIAGAIGTGLVASALPNDLVAKLRQDIENGHTLMIVKVEPERSEEIRELVSRNHPEITYLGSRPKDYMVFP